MNIYNHTRKLFVGQEVTLASLKVMLVGAGYTFDATETAMTAATAQQVSGNGWTSGGETLASVAASTVNTADAKLDATDISKTATGGDIGPASGFVIYDSVSSKPLYHDAFGSPQTAGSGTPFNLNIHADGIYVVEAP